MLWAFRAAAVAAPFKQQLPCIPHLAIIEDTEEEEEEEDQDYGFHISSFHW